ncbi:P-loop containing nucleoside triphosphate hydrolase protein [Dunaliella salina]|uniref:P-loop containing nucleoside triphosphate hydrolase protein n=1 Tax=Dunaliella salina TaxID=3046 RepID=A0ABQ7H0J8_DUNSA|nr:P-loop containing nucleoside triphosphate hydrolase protein [Dunaliella salina]|eukprot:KAF5840381.1 P-loop containing nucleoside triphosphate hydrolase protein [Dunaliella salina]
MYSASVEFPCRAPTAHARDAPWRSCSLPQRSGHALSAFGKPARDFLSYNFEGNAKDEATSNECQFSRNLVVLEVRGMPYNLTLIDLPGIINSTEHPEDTHLIQLIREVVKSYISKPRTVIVAAISCKNDIDNQTVFALAKEVKEGKQQTLGVLTKADQIEEGCHDGWLAVMQGAKFELELGYFMVRNSTKVELDEHIGTEEAARKEEAFFEDSVPLQPLKENKDLSQRLVMTAPVFACLRGVPSLIKTLSDILVQKVKQQLPDMKQSVDEQLKKARAELAELPPAVQKKDRADVLQQALRSLERLFYAPALHTLRCRQSSPAKLTIEQVKDIVAKERSYELPKFTPYTALQSVIQHFQGMWNEHAFLCLDKSAELLKAELSIIIGKHFGRFRESHMESIVSHGRILDRMKALLCKYQMRGVDQQVLKQDVAYALAALTKIPGFQGMTQDQLLALQPRNSEVGEELPIMAATMAYFKISCAGVLQTLCRLCSSITRLLYVRVAESIEGHVDRYLKRLSARAAAGERESANPLLLMEGGQADASSSRQWQDSEAVLSMVACDPKVAKLRGSLQAKLESLQATRSVLSRFA